MLRNSFYTGKIHAAAVNIDAFDQFSLCSCIGGIYEGDHGLLDLAELGDGLIRARDQQDGRKNGSK